MDFIFEDQAFESVTLRVAGYAGEAGADLGEVLATAARIADGDEDAWTAAWRATAVRTARRGEALLAAGDRVSAREAFLRTSNYYRAAEFPCGADVMSDPQLLGPSRCASDYFVRGAEMLDGPFSEVTIPYGDGDMPGYLLLVDDSGKPRPTIIYTNGFGSTCEEGYFVVGAAALRRGYNFLAYDGPGQGRMIRERNLPYRADWEGVLGAVVDYALTVPEIDRHQIVQFGDGLGGYLAARHAVYDNRSAAIVCSDAMTTFYASSPPIPEPLLSLVEEGRDAEAMPMLEVLMKGDTRARWGLQAGKWAFGVDTIAEYVRSTADYTLTASDIQKIETPVLLVEGEKDDAFPGQAANFARAMAAPVRHVVVDSAHGAGMQQTVFDHLSRTLD